MPDREKVIKGLEICSEYGSWHGLDCKYNEAFKDCPYRWCQTGCVLTIAKDALELLKEQQPEIIYCADCPPKDREECEKQYGRVQNEWNCRFGRRYEKR